MQVRQIKKEYIALEHIGKNTIYLVIKSHEGNKYYCTFARIGNIYLENIIFYDKESKEYGILLYDNPDDFKKYFKYNFEEMRDINWERKNHYFLYLKTITKQGDFIVL